MTAPFGCSPSWVAIPQSIPGAAGATVAMLFLLETYSAWRCRQMKVHFFNLFNSIAGVYSKCFPKRRTQRPANRMARLDVEALDQRELLSTGVLAAAMASPAILAGPVGTM